MLVPAKDRRSQTCFDAARFITLYFTSCNIHHVRSKLPHLFHLAEGRSSEDDQRGGIRPVLLSWLAR